MERLQELKNEVAAQEMKLKSLQLKRQQQQQQHTPSSTSNGSTEQEAMGSLIFLKEKELALALMKVAELTGQLEKLKRTEVKSESPPRKIDKNSTPRWTMPASAVENKSEERRDSDVSTRSNHTQESNGTKTTVFCQGSNNEKMRPSRSFDVSMATTRGRSSTRDQFFSSSFSSPSSSSVVSDIVASNDSASRASCIVLPPSLTTSTSQVPRDGKDFSNKLRHSTSSSIMSKFAPKPYSSRSSSVDCGLARRPLLQNARTHSQDDADASIGSSDSKSDLDAKNVRLLPKSASFHYGYDEKENAVIRARRSDSQHGDIKTTSSRNSQPNDSTQNAVSKPKITPKPVHLLKDSKPIRQNDDVNVSSHLDSSPPPQPPKRKGRSPSAISTIPLFVTSNDSNEIPRLRNNLTITLSQQTTSRDSNNILIPLSQSGATDYESSDKSCDESEVFKKGCVRELSKIFSQIPKEGSVKDNTQRHLHNKIEKSAVDKSSEPSVAPPSNECLASSKHEKEANHLLPAIDISANAVSSALSILLSSGNSRQATASRPNRLFGYSSSFSRPKFAFVPSSQTRAENKDGDGIPPRSDSSDAEILRGAPKAPTIYSLFSPPPKAKLSTGSTTSPEKYPKMNDLVNSIAETKSAAKRNVYLPRLSYITLSSDLIKDDKEEVTPPQKVKSRKRVTIDPSFLFLSAAVEGELDVIKSVMSQVANPDLSNDSGMTALHVAVCNNHFDVVKFLLDYGCDANAPNCECWTPLHYAALGNKTEIAEMLLTSGACVFALTAGDHETPVQKCQSKLHHYQECVKLLEDFGNELGIANEGVVYSAVDYTAECENECSLEGGEMLRILRRGDEEEAEWWWASKASAMEGYVPRSVLSLHPKRPRMWRGDK